jgi:hypothetical protein
MAFKYRVMIAIKANNSAGHSLQLNPYGQTYRTNMPDKIAGKKNPAQSGWAFLFLRGGRGKEAPARVLGRLFVISYS